MKKLEWNSTAMFPFPAWQDGPLTRPKDLGCSIRRLLLPRQSSLRRQRLWSVPVAWVVSLLSFSTRPILRGNVGLSLLLWALSYRTPCNWSIIRRIKNKEQRHSILVGCATHSNCMAFPYWYGSISPIPEGRGLETFVRLRETQTQNLDSGDRHSGHVTVKIPPE